MKEILKRFRRGNDHFDSHKQHLKCGQNILGTDYLMLSFLSGLAPLLHDRFSYLEPSFQSHFWLGDRAAGRTNL